MSTSAPSSDPQPYFLTTGALGNGNRRERRGWFGAVRTPFDRATLQGPTLRSLESMTRVGLIGCGKIARKHLSAYRKIEDVDVVVTDIDPEKRSVAREFGVEWCGDPEALLSRDYIDAIDVCIPVTEHQDAILDALDHDKHVFCEKPVAQNRGAAKTIEAKAQQSDRTVMVGYLYRFHPAFRLVKEVLSEGVIGKPYFAIFRVGGRGSHREWKHRRESGGGAGNEMLVHMVDLLLWYFDGIAHVDTLRSDTVLGERTIDGDTVEADAEDLVVLDIETREGAEVLCQSDLITPSYMNYVEIHGDNGSMWASLLDYFPTIVYCEERRGIYDKGRNVQNFGHVDLFERELAHFLDCIRGDDEPQFDSLSDSVEVTKVIESALLKDVR